MQSVRGTNIDWEPREMFWSEGLAPSASGQLSKGNRSFDFQPLTRLRTEHRIGHYIGDKGVAALAPAIGELKTLTTLFIDGEISVTHIT